MITCVDGVRFYCSYENEIEREIMLTGTFEPVATELVRRFVRSGQTAFDVGANVGYYALLLSKLVAATGVVHAFEPTSYARQRFERNVELNAGVLPNNIVLSSLGLLAEPAQREEAIESQFSSRQPAYARLENISFTTLDRYCESHHVGVVDFVKIDVDGYDHEVLAGGRATLTRCRPLVLCELCDRVLIENGSSVRQYLASYAELGYDRFVTEAGMPPRPLGELFSHPNIETGTVNALLFPIGRSDVV